MGAVAALPPSRLAPHPHPRSSLQSEARQDPVSTGEEEESPNHRPSQRGPTVAIHFRDDVRGRDVDRDAGRQRKGIANVSAGQPRRTRRTGQGHHPEHRTGEDGSRPRPAGGEDDRGDGEALRDFVEPATIIPLGPR